MKRFILFGTILAALFSMTVANAGDYYQPFVRTQNLNVQNVPVFEAGLGLETSGSTWYVDSGASGTAAGTSWTDASLTLDAAINLATASNGDIIRVAAGHAESFTAADGFDVDKAGITIIFHGSGLAAATFTFADTDATVAIGAPSVRLLGPVRFLAGISEVVIGVSVEAAATDFIMDGAVFPEPSGATSYEFNIAISVASGAHRGTIQNVTAFSADATGADAWLSIVTGAVHDWKLINNRVFGEYALACVNSDQINLEMYIEGGEYTNMTTGVHALEFSGATTGSVNNVLVRTDTQNTALDPGSMTINNVLWDDEDTADSTSIPVVAAGPAVQALADVQLDNLMALDGATQKYPENAATDSVIAKILVKADPAVPSSYDNSTDSLEAISDALAAGTGATVALAAIQLDNLMALDGATQKYPENAATDSVIAKMLVKADPAVPSAYDNSTDSLEAIRDVIDTNNTADQVDIDAILADTITISGGTLPTTATVGSLQRYIAGGDTGLGTDLGASKSLVDAIGTDGVAVLDTAVGIAGMIGVDDADNAMATTAVVANADGSVFERLEAIGAATGPSYNSPNYFVVTADMTSATWNTVAAHEIAAVVGLVRMQIVVETVATIVTASTNGTMALGFAGNTSAIFSATALDTAVTGDIWQAVFGGAATTDIGGADAKSALTSAIFDVVVINGTDVGYTIGTNAGTTGSLKFHVWWTPLSSDGAVTAGAGGPFS